MQTFFNSVKALPFLGALFLSGCGLTALKQQGGPTAPQPVLDACLAIYSDAELCEISRPGEMDTPIEHSSAYNAITAEDTTFEQAFFDFRGVRQFSLDNWEIERGKRDVWGFAAVNAPFKYGTYPNAKFKDVVFLVIVDQEYTLRSSRSRILKSEATGEYLFQAFVTPDVFEQMLAHKCGQLRYRQRDDGLRTVTFLVLDRKCRR